ncbi:MAG: hypothetical protein DSO07_01195 [Thermoproteota archaeon]|nr:MAG: hypothetical protein DSO07_01195 [Candidatus Korarchaeota archaeon]
MCAELWQERQVLMIPKCLQTLIVIEGYLEAFPEKVKSLSSKLEELAGIPVDASLLAGRA